jgi:hypothetical protein
MKIPSPEPARLVACSDLRDQVTLERVLYRENEMHEGGLYQYW